MRKYLNPWITDDAYKVLCGEKGTILDVGGGSSPYVGASHILDIGEFSEQRLADNSWGIPAAMTDNVTIISGASRKWSERQYTQFDLCGGKPWPFKDKQFDLGLCSHTLEDLRDPLPAARELFRVCKRTLIICPSRLFEQTKGVDHPRYCGFPHHIWMVYTNNENLIFRRKSGVLYTKGCHLVCPLGKTLNREAGSMFVVGSHLQVKEQVFHEMSQEAEEYRSFLDQYRSLDNLFVSDGYRHNLKYWVWRFRQKYFGNL
ncbi:MAG: methyltransferase domain-containing protein [Kiritimatiellae bacterium]|nr:methyltransferase domain-containing protein [Kiritimatiellia bacterium]MDD5521892.1 methyltransferase domain-containing protein [Kiritimatiellia bacterium]